MVETKPCHRIPNCMRYWFWQLQNRTPIINMIIVCITNVIVDCRIAIQRNMAFYSTTATLFPLQTLPCQVTSFISLTSVLSSIGRLYLGGFSRHLHPWRCRSMSARQRTGCQRALPSCERCRRQPPSRRGRSTSTPGKTSPACTHSSGTPGMVSMARCAPPLVSVDPMARVETIWRLTELGAAHELPSVFFRSSVAVAAVADRRSHHAPVRGHAHAPLDPPPIEVDPFLQLQLPSPASRRRCGLAGLLTRRSPPLLER